MRRLRRTLGAGAGAVLAISLAACGSANDAGPTTVPLSVSPTPTASAKAVPTAVPTIVSTTPPEMSRTQKSANDFAVFATQVEWQAQMERSMERFNALLAPGAACPGCRQLRDAIASLTKAHYFITLDKPLEIRAPVPTSAKGDDYVVGVAFGQPAGKILDDQGRFQHRLNPQPDSYTQVSMTWDQAASTWRVTDVMNQVHITGEKGAPS